MFREKTVKVKTHNLVVRREPDIHSAMVGVVYEGEVYTIIDKRNGYGKLKSGLGWLDLRYVKRYKLSTKSGHVPLGI